MQIKSISSCQHVMFMNLKLSPEYKISCKISTHNKKYHFMSAEINP